MTTTIVVVVIVLLILVAALFIIQNQRRRHLLEQLHVGEAQHMASSAHQNGGVKGDQRRRGQPEQPVPGIPTRRHAMVLAALSGVLRPFPRSVRRI